MDGTERTMQTTTLHTRNEYDNSNRYSAIDLGSDVPVVVVVAQKHAEVIIPHEVGGGEHVFECVLESHVILISSDAFAVKIVAKGQCELGTALACYFAHAGLQIYTIQ